MPVRREDVTCRAFPIVDGRATFRVPGDVPNHPSGRDPVVGRGSPLRVLQVNNKLRFVDCPRWPRRLRIGSLASDDDKYGQQATNQFVHRPLHEDQAGRHLLREQAGRNRLTGNQRSAIRGRRHRPVLCGPRTRPALRSPPVRLTPGTRVGPYEVVSLLGAGGMAEVYRAKDTRLGRDVAIKVVSEALGGDGAFLERFDREAKLAASLAHPNVVALFDVGLQDGKPYFVTELLQGESLRERLAKGPIPVALALDWAAQMAQGLAAAHEHGSVHRDFKPENVFITRDGHVKLLDFGIAKLVEAVQAATPHGLMDPTVSPSGSSTGTGMVLGTPGYMSPEQVRGDPVDARTDFFSLGTVLYEMLCGRRAFHASSVVETGYAILHKEPEPLPETVPAPISQVVQRCLEKNPARRFHSARDLAFHLDVLRSPTSAVTPSAARSVRAKSWRRPRWWLLPLA